jgi:hypothetical protein
MIRIVLGFLIVMGSVGGLDNSTDEMLFPLIVMAGIGLFLMHSGAKATDRL